MRMVVPAMALALGVGGGAATAAPIVFDFNDAPPLLSPFSVTKGGVTLSVTFGVPGAFAVGTSPAFTGFGSGNYLYSAEDGYFLHVDFSVPVVLSSLAYGTDPGTQLDFFYYRDSLLAFETRNYDVMAPDFTIPRGGFRFSSSDVVTGFVVEGGGDPFVFALDDIAVVPLVEPVQVPEPPGILVLLAGLCAAAAARSFGKTLRSGHST